MAETKIEWADRVWNPVTGCSKVSPGCQHCYAERMAKRLAGRYGYPEGNGFAVTLHPERWNEPVMWRKPSRIFSCSMGDLFHEAVPFEFVAEVYSMMAMADRHRYLVLTKRVERMAEFYQWWREHLKLHFEGLGHIWPGVTACNQDELWKVKELQDIPAAGHFVSAEPMLGPMNIEPYLPVQFGPKARMWPGLDWVIAGGETGPGARPAHPDWFRSLRDQCAAAGVPFFLKALDSKRNHLLDGREHREIPDALNPGGK